ncbi:hypothetical protein Tco_0272736 [Tanacetum coccineum]
MKTLKSLNFYVFFYFDALCCDEPIDHAVGDSAFDWGVTERRIDKEGNVSRFQEYHTLDEEEEELSEHPPYNKYRFVDHLQLQMEDQRNKFAPYPLPPQEGNMNGWLIDDANNLDLESMASNQPMSLTMEDIGGS